MPVKKASVVPNVSFTLFFLTISQIIATTKENNTATSTLNAILIPVILWIINTPIKRRIGRSGKIVYTAWNNFPPETSSFSSTS